MTTGSDPHSQAADAVHEHRPVEAQYVRQGRRGVRVLRILAIALALAILVVWGTWALFYSAPLSGTEANNARQPADAQAFGDTNRLPLQTAEEDPTAPERGSTTNEQRAVGRDANPPQSADTTPPAIPGQ